MPGRGQSPDTEMSLLPRGFCGADGAVLLGTHVQRQHGLAEGLDVIYGGRLLQIAVRHRERRAVARHAALAFQRFDQRRFFAADIGTRAEMDLDVEIETLLAEDAVTQQIAFAAALQHGLQGFQQIAVFAAQVEEPLFRADSQGAQRHALEQQIGLPREQHAILERARLALVGIAHHVMFGALCVAAGFPFQASGEACTAASAQAGCLDRIRRCLARPTPMRRAALRRSPAYCRAAGRCGGCCPRPGSNRQASRPAACGCGSVARSPARAGVSAA